MFYRVWPMSRIKPVLISEFHLLIAVARKIHSLNQEPIPSLHPSNIDKLESCLNTPFQRFAGQYLYKGFIDKAAIMFYLLVKNHCLENGNKRMAIVTLMWFCEKNHRQFAWHDDLLYELPRRVASSDAGNKDAEVRYIKAAMRGVYLPK